ncbi:hypothetical protein CYCD_24630 [Tenuifilaceae bacterium CYCD]|nr:hypothetical protein CYCD_24630 [Tenuifilaceae bacterium CYCD]
MSYLIVNTMKAKLIFFVIAIVSVASSCDRMEPYTNVEFVIINNSKYSVDLHYFTYITPDGYAKADTVLSIPQYSEIRVYYYDDMGSSIYGFPLGVSPDSVYLTFDNTKRIIYRSNDSSDKGILDINSYEEKKIDEHNYEFTYTITEDDYNNAVLIK